MSFFSVFYCTLMPFHCVFGWVTPFTFPANQKKRKENWCQEEKHWVVLTLLAFMLSEPTKSGPSQYNCFCNNVFHFIQQPSSSYRQNAAALCCSLEVYLMKSFCHLLLRDIWKLPTPFPSIFTPSLWFRLIVFPAIVNFFVAPSRRKRTSSGAKKSLPGQAEMKSKRLFIFVLSAHNKMQIFATIKCARGAPRRSRGWLKKKLFSNFNLKLTPLQGRSSDSRRTAPRPRASRFLWAEKIRSSLRSSSLSEWQ